MGDDCFQSVRSVDLSGTPVCDLDPLTGLYDLERLDVGETQVTAEEVERLRKALPNCTIIEP